jgi:GNAT superfamily N-acetyltransferase
MKIEVVNITEENLGAAPEWDSHPFSCKYCIYWEFPEECIDPAKEKREDVIRKKLAWFEKVNAEFGNCGMLAYAGSKPAGYAQYAPPRFLPRSAEYRSRPGDDAVLISCLFIPNKRLRKSGVGSHLLQSLVDDLRKRGAKAVETFARKKRPDNPSGPVEFYLKNGFKVHQDDRDFPLLRLEL